MMVLLRPQCLFHQHEKKKNELHGKLTIFTILFTSATSDVLIYSKLLYSVLFCP